MNTIVKKVMVGYSNAFANEKCPCIFPSLIACLKIWMPFRSLSEIHGFGTGRTVERWFTPSPLTAGFRDFPQHVRKCEVINGQHIRVVEN